MVAAVVVVGAAVVVVAGGSENTAVIVRLPLHVIVCPAEKLGYWVEKEQPESD